MVLRVKRRKLKIDPPLPTDREIVAALGYVPVLGHRPNICPDCEGRICEETCPTAAANGWPIEQLRERPF